MQGKSACCRLSILVVAVASGADYFFLMSDPSTLFNAGHAAVYDEKYAKLAPQQDALHLLIRILFGDLPPQARILCVGAGTGTEILSLARAFPGFEFTAVEPSAPMLDVCRHRTAGAGISHQCRYHHGFLETLPDSGLYDAATSLLVSQFLTDSTRRVDFFSTIARRLRPGGFLVNADLAGDLASPNIAPLKDFWGRMLVYAGASTPGQALDYLKSWRQHVAVLPPAAVASLIASSGFAEPTLFYQSLFIHGWFTHRSF